MMPRIGTLSPSLSVALTLAVLFALIVGAAPTSAGDGGIAGATFTAALSSAEEVPATGTGGNGEFQITLVDSQTALYTLSFRGLGGGDTLFAHIHIADPGVNGSVIIFLCGGGGKPACPSAGSVSGTITAADVMANADNGLAAGDFDSALRIIRSGRTYANVHTTQFPGGEIRGQISGG